MSFASFIKVREVSSEDYIHVAENLINGQTNKKWKTKNIGEKSAHVILEMSESHQIVGIDIGNEQSAFVEVLVGKSTCAPEDFKEILLTCSFMTPFESKSSSNINRVRCFSKEALVPNVVEDKWSLIKIICTQPFNRHVQYGLSFIKIHVQEKLKPKDLNMHPIITSEHSVNLPTNTKTNQDKLVSNVNKLKYREDSPETETEDSASLFSRWKKQKNEKYSSVSISNKDTVFQRRLSDAQAKNNIQIGKTNIRDRNRDDIAFEDDNLVKCITPGKLERLSKYINIDAERRRLETEKIAKTNARLRDNKSDTIHNTEKNSKRTFEQESSPYEGNVKKTKPAKFTPFNQLLRGVVLVISGIQNPERSDLRNKALAMGAKYKGDWDSTCTHLICAFKNTPKYNQVRSRGKIVSPSWIKKCYSLKKYLPWRRYALDSNELNKPESDEEINAEPDQNQTDQDMHLPTSSKNKSILSSESNSRLNASDIYDVDDRQLHSDCDTDDEIMRVEESLKNKRKIYDESTDEDDYLKEKYNQI